jgi:hypothetical protein
VACLWAAISAWWPSSPALAVDLLQTGQTAPRQGILLDVPTSFRVLEALEDYPRMKEENQVLRELIARHEALEEIRKEREALYRERIAFLEEQAGKWEQLNQATLALAEKGRKMQGSWWDRFTADVGKFSLGAVIGLGIVAAIAF